MLSFLEKEDYLPAALFGALVVVLVVLLVLLLRRDRTNNEGYGLKNKGSFAVIPPPRGGWGSARGGGIHGGTIPGWGDDFTHPPF